MSLPWRRPYISRAEKNSSAPTIVLNPATLKPLMPSIAKYYVLHRKKRLLPCFALNVCLYILLYATEACPLLARDLSSLECTTTRGFMKIFCTSSSAVIAEFQRKFNFLSVQRQLTIRTAKFCQAFVASDKNLCSLFENVAVSKLNNILSSFSVKSIVNLSMDCPTYYNANFLL